MESQMNNIDNFDVLTYYSPHFSERDGSKINAIITHSVGVPLKEILSNFDHYQVSSHYIVPQIIAQELITLMPDEFGNVTIKFPNTIPVIQLVDDNKKAWHAGISSFSDFNNQPGCAKGLNPSTIGIEFHAPGYANGDGSDWYAFVPYTNGQKETGIKLISHLMSIYHIPNENLFGHSTISVGRKTDPGALFFWKELADQGFGYIPNPKKSNISAELKSEAITFIQNKLFDIGFINCPKTGELDSITRNNIDAYVLQFAPDLWVGKDTNLTQALIDNLNGFNIAMSSMTNLSGNTNQLYDDF
jgi:N-acetylmuramoyl-L-alanine amidase